MPVFRLRRQGHPHDNSGSDDTPRWPPRMLRSHQLFLLRRGIQQVPACSLQSQTARSCMSCKGPLCRRERRARLEPESVGAWEGAAMPLGAGVFASDSSARALAPPSRCVAEMRFQAVRSPLAVQTIPHYLLHNPSNSVHTSVGTCTKYEDCVERQTAEDRPPCQERELG